jgi:hypothetical protein
MDVIGMRAVKRTLAVKKTTLIPALYYCKESGACFAFVIKSECHQDLFPQIYALPLIYCKTHPSYLGNLPLHLPSINYQLVEGVLIFTQAIFDVLDLQC